MVVQVSRENTTVPFIRLATPAALKQDGVIAKDTGRSIALAPFTALGKIRIIVGAVVDGTNTGNGTCTTFALAFPASVGGVQSGNYNLECIEKIGHGGNFKLEDPQGNLIADNLLMTAGAGVATTFQVAGLTFIITDGGTDFEVGDLFTLPVAAGSEYLPLDPAALNGAQQFAGIYMGPSITAAAIVAAAIPDKQVLVGDAYIDKNQLVLENSLALTTILPSGNSVEDEMAYRGIFNEDTIDISSFEN